MTQQRRTYGNGMTMAQARAAQQRWLDIWHLKQSSGRSYTDIGRELGITGYRVSQLCAKGERVERVLAKRPRDPWVADVWGDVE